MKRIASRQLAAAAMVFFSLVIGATAFAQPSAPALPKGDPRRFEKDIEAFLVADKQAPPQKGQILFIGSSIFRLWKNLKEQMAPLPVFNRAFGGSRTADILYYMDKVVLPYEPKIIVSYCGSNDINADINAGQDRRQFPGIHPTRSRPIAADQNLLCFDQPRSAKNGSLDWVDDANRQIKEFCEKDKKLGFIDVNPALFDRKGKPRLELYLPDKLHFLEPAYDEFTKIIKPVIEQAWKKK